MVSVRVLCKDKVKLQNSKAELFLREVFDFLYSSQ